jgi:hypothetical protein
VEILQAALLQCGLSILVQSVQSVLHIFDVLSAFDATGTNHREDTKGSPEVSISPRFRDLGVNWGVNCDLENSQVF